MVTCPFLISPSTALPSTTLYGLTGGKSPEPPPHATKITASTPQPSRLIIVLIPVSRAPARILRVNNDTARLSTRPFHSRRHSPRTPARACRAHPRRGRRPIRSPHVRRCPPPSCCDRDTQPSKFLRGLRYDVCISGCVRHRDRAPATATTTLGECCVAARRAHPRDTRPALPRLRRHRAWRSRNSLRSSSAGRSSATYWCRSSCAAGRGPPPGAGGGGGPRAAAAGPRRGRGGPGAP